MGVEYCSYCGCEYEFFSKNRAETEIGNEKIYFCSDKCRDAAEKEFVEGFSPSFGSQKEILDFLDQRKENFYRLRDALQSLGGNYSSKHYPMQDIDEIIKRIEKLKDLMYEVK